MILYISLVETTRKDLFRTTFSTRWTTTTSPTYWSVSFRQSKDKITIFEELDKSNSQIQETTRQPSIVAISIYSLNKVVQTHAPAQHIVVAPLAMDQDIESTPCFKVARGTMDECGAAKEGARVVGKIIGTAEAAALKQHLYTHPADKSTKYHFHLSS